MLLIIRKTNADPPLSVEAASENANVDASIVWTQQNTGITWLLFPPDFSAGTVFDFTFRGYTGGEGPVVPEDPVLPITVNSPGAVVEANNARIKNMSFVCVGTVVGQPGYYKYDITVHEPKKEPVTWDPMIIIEK